MPSWIPEQAARARERGLCQSAALGSPGTPHTFAIFGQKISLAQTRLCSNYTFLFWERGRYSWTPTLRIVLPALERWGWQGHSASPPLFFLPYPLPIFSSSQFLFPQIFHSFQSCPPEICRIRWGDWLMLQWGHRPVWLAHIWVLIVQTYLSKSLLPSTFTLGSWVNI